MCLGVGGCVHVHVHYNDFDDDDDGDHNDSRITVFQFSVFGEKDNHLGVVWRTREMAQRLKGFAILAEEPDSFFSINNNLLRNACSSSSRGQKF